MREISSFMGARPPLGGANTQSKKYVFHPVSAGTRPTMPSLGDADRVCFANRSIPHWRRLSSAFSFAKAGAKEKAIKKKTPWGDFALCGARPPAPAARASLPKGLSETLMEKGGRKP